MSSPRPSIRKVKKQGIPLRKREIGSRSPRSTRSPRSRRSPKRSASCKRNSPTLQRACGTDVCKSGKNHYYEQDDDGKRERISEEDVSDLEMIKKCSREKLTSTSGDYFLKEFTDKTTSILYDRISYECPQIGTVGTLVQQDKSTYLFVYQNEEGDDIALYVIQHKPGLIRLGLDKKLEVWALNRNWRRGYLVKSKDYCTPERLFLNQINPKESIFQYNNTILVSMSESRKYPYIINDNSQQYGHIYYILNTAVTAILNYGQPPELLADTYEYLKNFSKLFDRHIFIRMILAILDSKRNFINDRFIIREYLAEQGFIDRTDLTLLNIENQMNENILLGNVQFTPEISGECPRAGTTGKVIRVGHGWVFAYKNQTKTKTNSNNIKGLFIKQNQDKKLEVFGKNIAYNQAFYISKLVGYQKERIVCELFIKFTDDEQENAVLVYDDKAIPYPDIAYAEPAEGWFTWFNTVIVLGLIIAGILAFYISKDPSKLAEAYKYIMGITPEFGSTEWFTTKASEYGGYKGELAAKGAFGAWDITKNAASGVWNYGIQPIGTGFKTYIMNPLNPTTPPSEYYRYTDIEESLYNYYTNTTASAVDYYTKATVVVDDFITGHNFSTEEINRYYFNLIKDTIGTLVSQGVIKGKEALSLLEEIMKSLSLESIGKFGAASKKYYK